jgi:hypothetical protein
MADNEPQYCFVIAPIGAADSLARRAIDGLVQSIIEGCEVLYNHISVDRGTLQLVWRGLSVGKSSSPASSGRAALVMR